MEKKMRVGLIGCGKVGHTHARIYKSSPNAEFSAVCDLNPGGVRQFSDTYNVPGYSDPVEMIQKEGLQVVSICTPHPTHAELVIRAARSGAHVLVEKPLAPDLAGCDEAIAACETAGVKLGVISQRRVYRPVVRMREAILAGKIGKPILATMVVMGWRDEAYYKMDAWRGKWDSEGGGVMVNQTVHQIDLFQWLMGPIEELFGYWDNLNHPFIEVEDTALAVVKFKSGALGQLLVSNSQKPGFYGKIHVHGMNGSSVGAQTEGGSPFVAGVTSKVEAPYNDVWTIPGEESFAQSWKAEDEAFFTSHDVMSYHHQLQIQDFLEAVIDGRDPMVTGQEGRKAVEIFTAIYRANRFGRPVKFPLLPETDFNDFDGRTSYVPLSRRD